MPAGFDNDKGVFPGSALVRRSLGANDLDVFPKRFKAAVGLLEGRDDGGWMDGF